MRVLGFAGALGMTMAASALFGLWVGTFLDEKFGTTPWITLVMVCLSIYGGFRQAFSHLSRLTESEK